MPARWSIGTEALFGTDGGLWVRNGRYPNRSEIWTLFRSSGAEPSIVALPPSFELRAATPEQAYGAWTTESGTQVIRIYGLPRPQGR